MAAKRLTYGDLTDLQHTTEHTRPDGSKYVMVHRVPFLYCEVCQSEYSAHRGDYFMVADSAPITCGNGHPRRAMRRVERRTELVDV